MPQLDVYEKTPGVYITEEASPPPPPSGIPASTGAMFGVTLWGPVNTPVLVTSFSDWIRVFGSYISATYPAYKQVKKYFQNGGQRLYFVRIVHHTDITDPDTAQAVKAEGYIYDDSKVDATAGYQKWGFSVAKSGASASGLANDAVAAKQGWGFSGAKIGTDSTGLANDTTKYGFEVSVDGGAVQEVVILGNTAQTLTALCAAIDAELSGADCAFDETDDEILITSQLKGTAGSVSITDGGAATQDAPLFANITDADSAPQSADAGTDGTAYTVSIAIDGGGGQSISIFGKDAQTLQEVIDEINADLTGALASWDTTGNGFIKVTSALTNSTSSVAISDTSLFSSLTNANGAAESAVAGTDGVNYGPTDRRIKVISKYPGALGNDLEIKVAASSNNVAGEFKLDILLDGNLAEPAFDNLSVDVEASNYFIKMVNNVSQYIMLEDTTNTDDVGTDQDDVVLTSGDDGLTSLGNDDYIGNVTGQTGMKSLSIMPLEEPVVLACPDAEVMANPSTIQKAMADFCDDVLTTSFSISVVPDGKTPAQAKAYQIDTLSKDSPRMAIYYPFVIDEDDTEYISPVGAIMGVYARYAYDLTKGIWWSPAGTSASLRGIIGVKTKLNAGNAGLLNENRINIIKVMAGFGTVVWGARTLAIATSADFKYIGSRLNTSDIEARIYKNTKFATLKPNDSELYIDITTTCNSILNRRYKDGGLDGASKEEAYGVICNSAINTQQLKNQGIVKCAIGIRNKQTAEFIWFNIAQFSSGGTIEE